MGRSPRPRPARLGEKLLAIRQALGHSQTAMCRALELSVEYSAISQYELGTREPPLPVLLRYAELANVYVDALIDDRLDLPDRIPPRQKSAGMRYVSTVEQRR
jgi:transcriptional regulator with XRE-family HTH domain